MNNDSKCTFIVLAAGKGSRFDSSRPKVLAEICGRSVLDHVLALTDKHETVLVLNPELHEKLAQDYSHLKIAVQASPLGTGNALSIALEHVNQNQHVFILMGDVPLLKPKTIQMAIDQIEDYDLVFGMFRSNEPNQYGRVMKDGGAYSILEYTEYSPQTEFYNAGWMCINSKFLGKIREQKELGNNNSKEDYLTKYVEVAKSYGLEVSESECIGINTYSDYAKACHEMRNEIVKAAFASGVDFIDPDSVHMNWDTKLEAGCKVHPNVAFGPSVTVGTNTEILPFTYISDSEIGSNCTIGPFAYIRNNTQIKDSAHIGSFCEVNRSSVGSGTKSKHQSYIGDAEIGENVNIGAGTVFLNYDGAKKQKTIVGSNSFLGGNTAYVAPVNIGDEVYVGAGTIVRQDIPECTLFATKPKNVKCRRK